MFDTSRPTRRQTGSSLRRKEARAGLIWVQWWFVGFLLFTLIPICAAIYLSFTSWQGIGAPQWIGIDNYVEILSGDPVFWKSLRVTALYTALALPSGLVLGFGLAMLMNQKLRGITVFRTIYYLPSILSGVPVLILWMFVFNRDFGILNWMLDLVGIPAVPWLNSEFWVVPAITVTTLWGVGGSVIIYLAGLQGVPTELYEVATLDGAGWWRTLFTVTLPMMSPVIFFQLVLALIGSLQVFAQAYILTGGGPNYASYFMSLYIYNEAFIGLRLGYASALAVILFILILIVTAVVFGTSRFWVYYGDSVEGDES
jgi:multiple sugar transport system permease protein